MTRVWEHAEYKESTLLILLALADFADDNGICWPEVPTLAAKARVSDRRAIDIIQALEKDGAIVYQRGGGRGRRSLYGVLVGLTDEQKERVKLYHRNYFSENKTVKPGAIKGELQRKERVNYSVNSRKGSEQQDAPNPDPIRHVDPSIDPSVGESAKKDTEKHSRTLSELALAIADVCKINPKIATKRQREQLNEAYQSLKAIRATPAEVQQRGGWWNANDWRAKKESRPPRPMELVEIWEAATVPIKQSNATRSPADLPLVTAVPRQTPEEQKAAAARRRAILKEYQAGK